eukprot:TRINITY_DN9472_c0_g1_i1.p1 TRINITY_DN9472_c0_g1~~TRINITY_DN9472_c0_g1_i1.p1  ORF type:complete len:240 (-),score=87.20 TRINITY_DN9472_c0_g1_i1:1874-2593(-)
MAMEDREEFNIVDKKNVNNELLGNVLRGLLYSVKEEEIVDSLDQFFNDDDVYEARKILVKNYFHLFEDEEPNGRYMGPKEREIKKKESMDEIVDKMQQIARMDHDVEFCIPWNYSYIVVSDEEKRFREMVRQKDLEIDMKFNTLEKVIETKNREMISAVENIVMKLGSVDLDGEIYIHSPDSDDAASLKGAVAGSGQGGIIYTRRIFDVQILNSLIVFCLAGFAVKLALHILSIFSINI